MSRELALIVSGASGMILAARFAAMALEAGGSRLHVVVTAPAAKVLAHELGSEWASSQAFCRQVAAAGADETRLCPWTDADLMAPIASGSHRLAGTVVLPCSAGMVGSLAAGSSRGLGQRAADVALKERWPLVLAVRETPMSLILLENLVRLARAGAHIVPPVPAFYLKPDAATAQERFVDHFCLRLLDVLGIDGGRPELRWSGA